MIQRLAQIFRGTMPAAAADARPASGQRPPAQLRQDRTPQPAWVMHAQRLLRKPHGASANLGPAAHQYHAVSTPGYQSITLDATTPRAMRDEMLQKAKLASYPYARDASFLPQGTTRAATLAKICVEKMRKDHPDLIRVDDSTLVDPKSGLTASLLFDCNKNKIVIAFGGTGSGKNRLVAALPGSTPESNFMSTLSQWGANVSAFLGIVPKSYQQASALLGEVKAFYDKNGFEQAQDLKIEVVGHSKGASEAIYAAAKQRDRYYAITATVFCPAHLSSGLMKDLSPENIASAPDYIRSYSPIGDPVSGMRGKLPGIPGLGCGYHFPGIDNSDPIALHVQLIGNISHFRRQALA